MTLATAEVKMLFSVAFAVAASATGQASGRSRGFGFVNFSDESALQCGPPRAKPHPGHPHNYES